MAESKSRQRVVFLFDVDNTLLDNDRVTADLKWFLGREVGSSRAGMYWTLFEQLRTELGYADYLGALQRYRIQNPHEPRLLAVSRFLVNYPFANRLFPNSLDVIEHVAHANDWAFERNGKDEISISVAGNWTDYHVSFSWMEDFEALHLACAFDIKVPETRTLEVMRLLSLINEQMLFGHFDLWEQEGAIMFRQSLLLAGGAEPTSQQVEVLLSSALEACECYFQSFQFVVWSGTSAKDALSSVLFETHGRA